jgi:alkylation response protein AidB-like acyl-CoA dehydrogenase
LARTEPEAPLHEGISYFICPMDAPGVTVRPLTDMTGTHTFNEVFLDDVRLAADNLVGERGRGWSLAKVTLGNERVSLSGSGSLWGMGPTAADLVDLVRSSGRTVDPLVRQRLAGLWAEGEILSLLRLRMVTAALAGIDPGPEVSVRKALADAHGQRVLGLANELAGAGGMIWGTDPTGPAGLGTSEPAAGPDPLWGFGFLFAPALTIGGGTAEVQRNIIAERTLGLPRDPPGGG